MVFGDRIFLQAGGGCDSGVAYGTAVATFNSNGNYNGHAGAFIECSGNNVRVSVVNPLPADHDNCRIWSV